MAIVRYQDNLEKEIELNSNCVGEIWISEMNSGPDLGKIQRESKN